MKRVSLSVLALLILIGCTATDAADVVGRTLENTAHEWCRTASNCTLYPLDDERKVATAR